MMTFVWILVLMLNPEERFPVDPSELEIAERAFLTQEDCLSAKAAMERGMALMNSTGNQYKCVYEENFIARAEMEDRFNVIEPKGR